MHKTFGKCTQTADWNYELVSPLHLIRLLYKVCQYLGPGIRSRLVTPLACVGKLLDGDGTREEQDSDR